MRRLTVNIEAEVRYCALLNEDPNELRNRQRVVGYNPETGEVKIYN